MVFVGVLDAANAQQRYQGLREALKDSNVQIVDVRTDNADRVRAKSNAADTLVNHPDIAGLVGPNSLDFAVMGAVILIGVMADQIFTERRNRRQFAIMRELVVSES